MRYLFIVLAIAGIYIAFEAARVAYRIRVGEDLAKRAQPYERAEGTFSILVLGDSTAVGVGASDPKDSTAGRLSAYLDATIENAAVSGALMRDIPSQIGKIQKERYDLVLIQAGANDVIRRHSVRDTAEQAKDVLSLAKTHSDRVVLLSAGDIGDAPLFPRIVSPFISKRSIEMRDALKRVAEESGTAYVDLIAAGKYPGKKEEFYAADGLHLSGEGYGFWFDEIQKTINARWPELVD